MTHSSGHSFSQAAPSKTITVTCILLLVIFGALVVQVHYQKRIANFRREENVIRERASFATYDFCSFSNDDSFFGANLTDYKYENCKKFCGKLAYAFRTRRLNASHVFGSPNDKLCFDQHEMVPCSDFGHCYTRPKESITECEGFAGKLVIESNETVAVTVARVPLFREPNDTKTMRMSDSGFPLVTASSLIGTCPTCTAVSAAFQFAGYEQLGCFKNLLTLSRGEPGILMYCDEFENIQKCPSNVTMLDRKPPSRFLSKQGVFNGAPEAQQTKKASSKFGKIRRRKDV